MGCAGFLAPTRMTQCAYATLQLAPSLRCIADTGGYVDTLEAASREIGAVGALVLGGAGKPL